jgi:hypothetical protein
VNRAGDVLLLDDLLFAPVKGVFWVFRKIHQAVEDELETERQRTTSELSELYMQLDTGKITEEEFDRQEHLLLERLDRVKKQQDNLHGAEGSAEAGEQEQHASGGGEPG